MGAPPQVTKAKSPRRRKGTTRPDQPRGLPIVGIGASAGGLEAIDLFLKHVPHRSGLAFVIVQHLDPTHKGMMAELLQRATAMPVREVKDRVKVEPDHVYVIPPDRDLSLLHGVLHLLVPSAPRGLRLPIDFFFRSLAEDLKDRSIGVVLSGMGTDGTLGLRAIKEQAGVVFVQTPASAKFDGMPRSAIDAGLADVTAPVEEIPARIINYLQHAPLIAYSGPSDQDDSHGALEKVFILLRRQIGHDFSQYKRSTISRRIERRMGLHQIRAIAQYVRYLQENPLEVRILFKELLIGVTSFFRDPAVWDELKNKAIPALLSRRPSRGPLRAWVPGCSTGEEAYSLAMVIKEVLEQSTPNGDHVLQVFATDLDKDAIDQARLGLYPANVIGDISPERLRRFFIEESNGYRVGREIREDLVFAPHSVIMDAPFTRLDIISCRNLFIYLAPELQKKLLSVFHYALNPGGILILGTAETPSSTPELFAPLKGKARIYRRIDAAAAHASPFEVAVSFPPLPVGFPASEPRNQRPVATLTSLADQLLLRRNCPPTVLTTDKGEILYLQGATGTVLEPGTGGADWNIFAMARGGLRYELSSAFRKALRDNKSVTRGGIRMDTGGEGHPLEITVEPVKEPEGLRGTVLVVFKEVESSQPAKNGSSKSKLKSRPAPLEAAVMAGLQDALRTSREEMQQSREEMQTSQEELQSTNEELQSTNEELTTSKEEMQSMNEELQTLNQELQAKVDDLSTANNDMKNLLDSTDIATLFLDASLQVRRFTARTTKIFKLIPGDVGRPITDLASALIYPEMAEDARDVLQNLVPRERPISTEDGRWYGVRVLPYRTLENKIDGVVITFMDITVAKKLEATLRQARAGLEDRVGQQAQQLERARGLKDVDGDSEGSRHESE